MDINFAKNEEKIMKLWKENKIFERSIRQRKKKKNFVFYDGPITVNAKPGIHHVLARIFKDVVPRYKAMQGFRVERKNGWDTHGLPVELEAEKSLGFKTKKDIEQYGIAKFNKACRENVQKYIPLFRDLTEKIGYWVDMDHSYITYKTEYIETIWYILKKVWEKGLLYKDYKIVPYCPRCGTSLSSHEVAQGYKKTKEPAIYIKFKAKNQDLYFLVWTTTPWTLPGNVAIAINPNFTYVKARVEKDIFILAKERLNVLGKEYEILEEFKGKEILGLEFEPLFGFSKIEKKAHFVVSGNFVSLEEGTGIVHIAPAFGEDDMIVGKKNGLPIILNVDEEGKFKPEVKDWAGMFVKDADPLIIKELEKRTLLFKEEIYEHDYPYCWRCKSPLLYYAKESWWIKMTALKENLIKNNQKINWIPGHLKEGRFGEWLREVKDWAISRERYWGTPLPIWKCKKCKNFEALGSKEDLIFQKYSKNKYYILRHGESYWQTKFKGFLLGYSEKPYCPLTQKGVKKISLAAKKLKRKIDFIYSSDLLRTKQTAEIIAKETGKEIVFDERLRDIYFGEFVGQKREKLLNLFPDVLERFTKKIKDVETWSECKMRMLNFFKDIDKKHEGKNILIVSHGDPLWLLEGAFNGLSDKELFLDREKSMIEVGELRNIEAKFLPYDEEGNLNLHRPYADEVKFYCKKCDGLMEREKEVVDVWFDSGSMPFAQYHWPFEPASAKASAGRQNQKLKPPKLFPADYISEAIDQTRGWFYTLLAISALLGFESPYKNVVCLGHVLDEKGEKMSKSKGNIVDPWQLIQKYGADAVRWYFFTVNQPNDSKLFSENEVNDCLKRFLLTFWNCATFLEIYGKRPRRIQPFSAKCVLDRWVVSKMNGLILAVTKSLDNYDIVSAARSIEQFAIEDLSQWYVRRSRKRFQRPENSKELSEASISLSYILSNLSKLTAPFIPFLSEDIYKNLGNKKSIHLEDWPKVYKKLINKKLEEKMVRAREIVNLGLKARAKAGIRVRQPLRELAVGKLADGFDSELISLIKEELNVESFRYDLKLKEEIKLDEKITAELKEKGTIREIMRNIQEMRKIANLKPKDKILVKYAGTRELNEMMLRNKKFILKEANVKDLASEEKGKEIFNAEKEIKVDQEKLWLGIKKI